MAEFFDILLKVMSVSKIEIQSEIIIISPAIGDLKPKKAGDQSAFSKSWMKKIIIDFCLILLCDFFIHTRKNEIPIIVYRIVQTGANNHDGGLNDGLKRFLYQVGIAGIVNSAPIKPASWQIRIEVMN